MQRPGNQRIQRFANLLTSRPLHWIYDRKKLDALLVERPEEPEFWPESQSPFYTRPLGSNSGYFDATLVMTRALKETGGKTDIDVFASQCLKMFGPGTAYAEAFERRQAAYDPAIRKQWTDPVEGPWLHADMKEFLEHYDNGNGTAPYGQLEATETDGFCAAIPIIALRAGQEGLADTVKEVILTVCNSELCSTRGAVAAKILEAAILGSKEPIDKVAEELSDSGEYPEVLEELDEVLDAKDEDNVKVTARWGQNCLYPGNFMSACHAILTSSTYSEAVRKAIVAGGCNCSRSTFVGAVMAAMHGIDSIPKNWVEISLASEEIKENMAAAAASVALE